MTTSRASAATVTLPGRAQVVVAGGGPVGLATALELGTRGIDCVVVEPRAEVSRARPRCKTVNVRTMEHLRRWGLADRLRERAPLPVSWSQDIVFCTSLAGHELSRFSGVLGLTAEGDRFPERGQQAPQYVIEELLREAVSALPSCTLATGHRVVGVDQDPECVRVEVRDESGRTSGITADYAVGCDGPRSTVRDAIGARYVGEQALRPNFGMVFSAPALASRVVHGRAVQYWVVNDVAPSLMGPLDLDGTWWIIAFGVTEADGRSDPHRILNGAAGFDVDARVLSSDPWTARMQLVDQLRVGRVFLAGDAAHLNPPFGGHGMNTGIGDAVDLGWKLAAVLDGWADEGLLNSYAAERRPVQDRVIAEAARNMATLAPELMSDSLDENSAAGSKAREVAGKRIHETKTAEFFALDLVLDVTLDESEVVIHHDSSTQDSSTQDSSTPDSFTQDGTKQARAGARLPHTFLAPGRSIYDELGTSLSLLLLSPADPEPVVRAARARGIPLVVVDLTSTECAVRYGSGAVLVRPDQYVAWSGSLAGLDAGALVETVRGATASGTPLRPLPA